MRARSFTTTLTVMCAVAAVAVAVPAALASPPPGHTTGKPAAAAKHPKHSTAGHGKLKLTAQLTGTLTAVDAAGGSFVIHVKGGHLPHHGKDVTVLTVDKTVVRYHGHTVALSRVPVGAKATTKVLLFGDGTVFAVWVNVNGATKLAPLPTPSPSASMSPSASASPSDTPSASTSPSASASS